MMAGHTEFFRALVDLCKPNPAPTVVGAVDEVYEEVRNRMIDLYGTAVDHPATATVSVGTPGAVTRPTCRTSTTSPSRL